jgi:hypothetical protein
MQRQTLRMLGRRVWQNYLMPSRLGELEEWLRLSLARGYRFYSIAQYWRLTEGGHRPPPPKTVVLRHDVDVDVSTAEAMFRLERTFSITGSYYFRLSTIDESLMRLIQDSGAEASYHYEELASEAKATCLRGAEEVQRSLAAIRQRFLRNLESLRHNTGLPMTTVAAHGDWINRSLGVNNTEVLKSPELRQMACVQTEAYDPELMRFVSVRYADAAGPVWLGKRIIFSGTGELQFADDAPRSPIEAVQEGLPVLYVLLHPEQWNRGPGPQLKEHAKRVKEALAYRLRIPVALPSVRASHAS